MKHNQLRYLGASDLSKRRGGGAGHTNGFGFKHILVTRHGVAREKSGQFDDGS